MTADDAVVDAFKRLAELPDGAVPGFAPVPRQEIRCMVGTPERPILLRVLAGRVAAVRVDPGPLPDCQFAFQAPASVWLEFWQPLPRPGFHDLFALVKRGHATLTGDLQPLLAHLAFFKELLALPRGQVEAPA